MPHSPRAFALAPLIALAPVALIAEDHGRMFDLSLSIMSAVGASTADNHLLDHLQAGGHDPNQRGFTFQAAELSISGAIDPYFRGEGHLLFTPDEVELEEAFIQTTGLPYGLGVEAGYFLTEFGRNNPTHAHASAWLDRPVAVTRLLGTDGMRGPGARVQWSLPTTWVSTFHLGAQNGNDDTMISFRGEGHKHGGHGHEDEEDHHDTTLGGRQPVGFEGIHDPSDLVWLVRWSNAFDAGDWTYRAGASFLHGPNRTGADANTHIFGIDLAAKWYAPGAQQGAPYLTIEAEAILRRATLAAGIFEDEDENEIDLDEARITDAGGYLQALYGWNPRWAAGLRIEYLRGRGDSVDHDGDPLEPAHDPAREDRLRLSPVLTWSPSHFSRLRLQYNYDRFSHDEDEDHGEDSAHSVWLGIEILIGAHPAHVF